MKPNIIAVINQKGGVGKTTSVINLASALSILGQNNLIIDLDPQGNATTGVGISNNDQDKNIYNLLIKKIELENAIQKTRIENLDIVSSHVDLSGLEVETANDNNRAFILKEILENSTTKKYDNIFIDCPPSLSLLTIIALVSSKELLVPLQTEFFALEGITQLVKTIDRIKKNLNPTLSIRGIVLTMFDKRNKLCSQVDFEARNYFKEKVYNTVIPRNVRLSEAPSHGEPCVVYDKNCSGSKSYFELAKEFKSQNGSMSKSKKGLGRGLSALFGDQNNTEKTPKNQAILRVPLDNIKRNEFQPRINFDETKLNELASSIKQNGIIQPIAVRPIKGSSEPYQIVAGERRWLAAQKAGLHEIPVTILDLNDNEVLEVAIVENIQREDLNVVEEAKGYKRLNQEFGYDHDKIANMMSKSRSHVSNTLRLLNLPKDVISMLQDGELTAGQARPLVGLPNASQIAEEIVSKKMSARSIESIKKRQSKSFTIDPNIFEVQREIERSLGLKVNIVNKKNNSGKISIEYKNLEQFESVSEKLKRR